METKQESCSVTDMGAAICKPLAVFTIEGDFYNHNCLPSLNDLLSAAERHPMAYNRMKKDMEFVVTRAIRKYIPKFKAEGRVRLDITWGEKSKGQRRDYDNVVSAGRKIINDALTKNKVIEDDCPKYLGYGSNTFVYTDKVFIRVEIWNDFSPEK